MFQGMRRSSTSLLLDIAVVVLLLGGGVYGRGRRYQGSG
jgi:hypothetical protein